MSRSIQLMSLAMELKINLTMLFSLFSLFLFSVFYFFLRNKYLDRVPPGSLGLPFIGQTFGFLKALKADSINEWVQEGIANHGPIWKANLLGCPTIVLHGTAANKFVYTCDENMLVNSQPQSMRRMLGSNNILELTGDNHKRVKAAIVSFLKLEVLKKYVDKVDEEIRHHLETHWRGKCEAKAEVLIKTLTFNVISSLVFGIERGTKREQLLRPFQDLIESLLSIPIDLPYTQFNLGLKARKKVSVMLLDVLHEKREALKEQKGAKRHTDVITLLLSIYNDDNSTMMSDEEIIDNVITLMIAGYDTTSALLTFLVRTLANNQSVYSTIVQEQEEIAKNKAPGEPLTWDDLNKMKYTWRVASEILRIHPPINFTFRKAIQDIEYGGYIIPKGWQVFVTASMTHMDNGIFKNPTTFDPNRFEKAAPPPPAFSLLTFGAGPRMCPGTEFVKMETLAMMHRLVTQFTWELVYKDEPFKRIPLLAFDKGLLIRMTPKNSEDNFDWTK